MPIVSRIGRKHIKVRLLFAGMYLFLLIGAASMVYPFLLMVSGSTKSAVDIKFFDAFPRFLREDIWLYRKHMEGLFNERIIHLNMAYDTDDITFEWLEPPSEWNSGLVDAFEAFLTETPLPFYAYQTGYLESPLSRTIPGELRNFKNYVRNLHGQDILDVNRALETEFIGWNSVSLLQSRYTMRRERPMESPLIRTIEAFRAEQVPFGMQYFVSPEGFYKKQYLKTQFGMNIDGYNRRFGTEYASYDDVPLYRTYPDHLSEMESKVWVDFARNTLALHWMRADESARIPYQDFLKAKHLNIQTLNRYYSTTYNDFSEIPLIEEPPFSGMALSDWDAFFNGWPDPVTGQTHQIAASAIIMHGPDFMFRDFLLSRYGSIEAVNAALDTAFEDPYDIRMPQRDLHAAWFFENRRPLRWEFVTRNYKTVGEFLVFRGRGILNTVIYTGMAVLTALLVNPLAAYAMSRYKMPSSYKILLFLLCTMAFPPMVTQIPNFLMLRRLGLLNTFAALILPGMANGYSIFLLKGFFDAQPRELYESASLDGASEWTMFWQITMSLSKPILAVISLSAFTAAYSNFMFAFVICQDERMWTLMVWLYQLQQRSGQAVMYASLIIAAIPTFLIFLFCQNIIMRGIVVPSEK